MDNPKPANIDEYIARFPKDVRNLVHFAAYKHHIGFYPTPLGIEKFKKELSVYKRAKDSVQFPVDRPLPFDLVGEIVKFRVQENLERAKAKKK